MTQKLEPTPGLRADPHDLDDFDVSEGEVQRALVARQVRRGAQKAPVKELISIRLSSDVLAVLRASGKGWQSRVDDLLRGSLGMNEVKTERTSEPGGVMVMGLDGVISVEARTQLSDMYVASLGGLPRVPLTYLDFDATRAGDCKAIVMGCWLPSAYGVTGKVASPAARSVMTYRDAVTGRVVTRDSTSTPAAMVISENGVGRTKGRS
jgi:uncharacterized protein (DUF4415 family)